MPIRTGRLWRVCKICGEAFKPRGSSERLCLKCFKLKTEGRVWRKNHGK
ncbi:MAG: hypothetical protein WC679_12320 [Bacteroidales bacterium]|jgi:hypothetical protein